MDQAHFAHGAVAFLPKGMRNLPRTWLMFAQEPARHWRGAGAHLQWSRCTSAKATTHFSRLAFPILRQGSDAILCKPCSCISSDLRFQLILRATPGSSSYLFCAYRTDLIYLEAGTLLLKRSRRTSVKELAHLCQGPGVHLTRSSLTFAEELDRCTSVKEQTHICSGTIALLQ